MHELWQRLSAQLAVWFPRTAAYLKESSNPHVTVPVRQVSTPKKAASKPPSTGYVPFKISQASINAMREKVQQAVAAGLISEPSSEQWAMIVCKKPITRVFAGAGSGKSATLVLRVLFMLAHLGVERSSVTVISFTNASCQELRERLLKLSAFWQYPLSQDDATQLVRTFHSAMGVQARSLGADSGWFEQLGSQSAELDQPSASLKPVQVALLKQAFDQACQTPGFLPALKLLGVEAKADAPYRLAGMLRAAPLVELFYQEASFAQSIGLEVSTLDALPCLNAKDHAFVQALSLFWPHFSACLAAQGLRTFDQAFIQLTQTPAPLSVLAPLQHVLIDEFQDISAHILKWLLSAQSCLAGQGRAVSLMAIGDDWQSIYGWRGSSPELFIELDRHLKNYGIVQKSHVLHFVTNYRCCDAVLAQAQRTLDKVALKQDKACVAFTQSTQPNEAVRVVEGFDSRTQLAEVVQLIARISAQTPEATVLVLSRRNQILKRLKPLVGANKAVRLLSIHSAKGLQASVAIILDDCHAPLAHPVRNALYARAGLFGLSYDQAMADENLRLGYVAMTRAMQQVVWFTQKRQGASLGLT